MKKYIIAIGAAATLALTACGSSATAPTTTVPVIETTTTTTVAQLSKADKENLFIVMVGQEYPMLVNTLGKKALVDLANTVCYEIEYNGLTTSSLTDMIIAANLADIAGELGYVIGVGIQVLCPQNQWFIDTIGG
jgi:hypothetical protein